MNFIIKLSKTTVKAQDQSPGLFSPYKNNQLPLMINYSEPSIRQCWLVVDFVQTISTTTNAALVAASKQDYPVARMANTSTSLMEIYTQTLQEARQNPKPDTHRQGMPLDLSIEHVIKTQLDNTDAIIMMGDAEAHPGCHLKDLQHMQA